MNLGYMLQILISLFFFAVGLCVSQVSVIHFNSEWNSDNSFNINELNDCEKSDVVICDSPELKDKHKILSVPTVIIFDNGNEIARFEANIMMQLEATRKEIQKEIEKIHLAKFE
jgi:hypothetical protein